MASKHCFRLRKVYVKLALDCLFRKQNPGKVKAQTKLTSHVLPMGSLRVRLTFWPIVQQKNLKYK